MGSTKSVTLAELADIEITSTSSLKKYVESSRSLCRDISSELDWAAEELITVLTQTQKGNPALLGFDVKIRARRIAKRARRAAELQRGSAVEMTRLWQDYLVQFAPAITPKKGKGKAKKTFNFTT